MTDQNEQAIDYAKIAEELEKLAETPNPKSMTLADHIRIPEIFNAITAAREQGHKAEAIAAIMAKYGVVAKPGSLEQTYRTVRREMRGETGVKSDAKPKTSGKKNATAKSAETGANKSSEPKPEGGAKPAATGTNTSGNAAKTETNAGAKPDGKTLNKSPSMGGAFSDEL